MSAARAEPSESPSGAGGAPFNSVGFMLSALGFAVSTAFSQQLAPLGIEPRDFALLRVIGVAEGQTQQAIGERLAIPPSRMVGLLDTLEARGLLERRANPSDRRARALFLTRRGRGLLQRAYRVAAAFEEEMCSDLRPGERERLLALLGRVAGRVGFAADGRAHPALSGVGE